MKRRVNVLLVDDSVTSRTQLALLLRAVPRFRVVGQVASGQQAVEAARTFKPDLVSLDVVMPGLSAAETVRRLRAVGNFPIVLVSSLQSQSSEVFDALAAGAHDFVQKPASHASEDVQALLDLFERLADAQTHPPRPLAARVSPAPNSPPVQVLVMVASTGGPQALVEFLSAFQLASPPPVVIAQHIGAGFDAGLVGWLKERTGLNVKLADADESLVPGVVMVGRGGQDIAVGSDRRIVLHRAPRLGYHPSGDTLFSTAAKHCGGGTAAVVFSGIGSDGTQGARAVVEAGGFLCAQNRESSVAFGMPSSIVEAGLPAWTGTPTGIAQTLSIRLGGLEKGRNQ